MKVFSVQGYNSNLTTSNKINKIQPDYLYSGKAFAGSSSVCKQIETELYDKYYICADFKNNDFLAKCVKKTAKLFNDLFSKYSLPDIVSFESLQKGILGLYRNYNNEVSFNSNVKAFNNKFFLKMSSLSSWNFLRPNDHSSLHSAHIFTHEFGHCAHWQHLQSRHGFDEAQKVWSDLEGYMVPDSVGKLIIRFKLGNYAVDAKDMCEFMAERVSKDICDKLKGSEWNLKEKPDVMYSDIFQRKWKYRYTNPQSYLDYFTQQVWNGDSEEALVAANRIKDFLKLIDEGRAVEESVKIHNSIDPAEPKVIRVRQLADIKPVSDVHPVIENLSTETQKEPDSLKSFIINFLYSENSILTRNLNDKNRTLLKL